MFCFVSLSSPDKELFKGSKFCNSVVFPEPVLPSMVTIGTRIFTIVLQNSLDTILTCEVLINSTIALQFLKSLNKA